ncbi:putative Thiamin pyrophosphokinase 1 [Hypsibius exemplaris]|uniref:Thiamin pyrophosphokinase 1 n=1 Tax=Hypsibius exemplaris TaxID=2072580 RepID=A0A1W0X424_HYPEX|nr:putative Thiamin pyrophosphokinase 1 [Hypsibius exemplaris]
MSKIRLLNCLQPGASRIALIFLHTELTADEVYAHRTKFDALWRNAVYKCAVDSGCNFLYEHFRKGTVDAMGLGGCPWIPDLISGDFDSIRKDALDFYRAFPGVRVEETPDQDATDFTKALMLVAEEIKRKNMKVDAIVALCSGKGRFDHNMGNINTLFMAPSITDVPVILMSELDVQYVISNGPATTLLLDTELEGAYCGLLPLRGPSKVSTTGLRWNLDDQQIEFGGLISTSNEMAAPSVTVQTSLPVVWTMSVKDPSVGGVVPA